MTIILANHIFICIFMPPPLGAGGIMFSGCLSVRPSVQSLKYPLSTCTWVRWSTRPTVTVLGHVRWSVHPSVCSHGMIIAILGGHFHFVVYYLSKNGHLKILLLICRNGVLSGSSSQYKLPAKGWTAAVQSCPTWTLLSRTPWCPRQAQGVWDRFIPA